MSLFFHLPSLPPHALVDPEILLFDEEKKKKRKKRRKEEEEEEEEEVMNIPKSCLSQESAVTSSNLSLVLNVA